MTPSLAVESYAICINRLFFMLEIKVGYVPEYLRGHPDRSAWIDPSRNLFGKKSQDKTHKNGNTLWILAATIYGFYMILPDFTWVRKKFAK